MPIIEANTAVKMLRTLADEAKQQGTFAVSGLLVTGGGQILASVRNKVIRDGVLCDQTAHGERQLIDWYWANKLAHRRSLPNPQELTLISSLDPCLMCAGAILASDLNVLTLTADPQAGIAYHERGIFKPLQLASLRALERQAARTFGYAGIQGEFAYVGPHNLFLAGLQISPTDNDGLVNAMQESLACRMIISGNNQEAPDVNPDVATAEQRKQLSDHLQKFLSETPAGPLVKMDALPRALARAALCAHDTSTVLNATAVVGPHGHVLMLCGDATALSPIRTSFMEASRNYTLARAQASCGIKGMMPHIKECTLVTLQSPSLNQNPIHALIDVGAYVASMDGTDHNQRHGRWLYVISDHAPIDQLSKWRELLPPLHKHTFDPMPKIAPKPFCDETRKWLSSKSERVTESEGSTRSTRANDNAQWLYPGVTSHL